MFRKAVKSILITAVSAICALSIAHAEEQYPTKPIVIIVPAAPGGGSDILLRIVSEEMSKDLKQPIVIENRPGAGGNIAANVVAKAKPDGYTLLMVENGILAINPTLYDNLDYNAETDLTPIGMIASFPFVLVGNPAFPATTVPDLVAEAQSKPGKVAYASPGSGTPQSLGANIFQSRTNVEMLHIPYKGGGPALVDILGGQVPIGFVGLPPAMPHIKSGKLNAFGVSSARRSSAAPEIPTLREAGVPDYDVTVWYGFAAPAGTPEAVLNRLSQSLATVSSNPDLGKRLTEMGADLDYKNAADFNAFVVSERKKWGEAVKASGATAN